MFPTSPEEVARRQIMDAINLTNYPDFPWRWYQPEEEHAQLKIPRATISTVCVTTAKSKFVQITCLQLENPTKSCSCDVSPILKILNWTICLIHISVALNSNGKLFLCYFTVVKCKFIWIALLDLGTPIINRFCGVSIL